MKGHHKIVPVKLQGHVRWIIHTGHLINAIRMMKYAYSDIWPVDYYLNNIKQ